MAQPNPIDSPEIYGTAVLAGVELPGVVEVTGGGRKYGWDKKKGKGSSGGGLTYGGDEIADPTLKVYLWTTAHFVAWATEVEPLFALPTDGSDPKALDIYHPALEERGIKSVVVGEVGQLTPEGGGLWSYTIACTEFRPGEPAEATPGGSATSGQRGPSDYVQAAADTVGNALEQIGSWF